MRHYEVGEWADFVRNLVSKKDRAEMEKHRTGCQECRDLVGFLTNVAAAAEAEQAYEPLTRGLAEPARQIFSQRRVAGRTRDHVVDTLHTLVAHLTYDSAMDPQPTGARAGWPSSRHMLYEAGQYCIDLRFDREIDSTRVTVVGQVANRTDPLRRFRQVPVSILSSTRVVAETASNEFGEFSLDCIPRRDLRLSLSIADAGVRVEIPLKRILEHHAH